MKPLKTFLTLALSCLLVACFDEVKSPFGGHHADHDSHGHGGHEENAAEVEKGEHRGRLLREGNFTLELAIFETGVPPEYRIWAYLDGQPVAPTDMTASVKLTRLGNVIDNIGFKPQGDFLRGDRVIYEPHSFVVNVSANHAGKQYQWQFDSFEGRTSIETDVAEALEIKTETAGPAHLKETLKVYGKVAPNTERQRTIHARFEGLISSANATLGERVSQGQALFTIESNESLKTYTITAPISGIVSELNAHPGEQTQGRALMRITDTSSLWAELAVFPADIRRVKPGAEIKVIADNGAATTVGSILRLAPQANQDQSINAIVVLDNGKGQWRSGMFVTADIVVDEYDVPLAVKRAGLQGFRDFTVVFAQIGNEYEVRMLELGRTAGEWVEVLGGLQPGTHYVTENSYVIKADIEKSGAAHDH